MHRVRHPAHRPLRIAASCSVALLLSVAALPARAIGPYRVPRPAVKKLANGLEIMVFSDPRLPLTTVELRVPAGVAAEPGDQNGVASVTARMLGRGTTSHSAETFARDLGLLGTTLTADAGREYAIVSSAFLSRDFESGLELVADAVIHPAFLDDEFRRAANSVGRGVLQLHASPPATAAEQLWTLALPDVPAARPPLGQLETLGRLTLDQVRAFYRDQYRPGGAVLAIAGDVTPERAYAAAAESFGSWPAGAEGATPAPAVAPRPRGTARTRIRIVNVPTSTACAIAVGLPVPGHRSDDALARSVAASLFEQHLGERIARGVVRDVNGSLELTRDFGLWIVQAAVPADSAAVLARRLTAELKRFLFAEPGLPDLAAQQHRIRRGFPLGFEPANALLGEWLLADFAGFPPDYFDTYDARIAALTPQEVHFATRREADAEHLYIVAVGPASRVAPLLKPLGPAEVVTLDQPGQAAADTLAPRTPEQEAAGRKRIAESLAAHGGRSRLSAIKSSLMDAVIRVTTPDREVEGTMRQLRKEPDKLALVTTVLGVESRQVLNGNRAWTVVAGSDTAQEGDSLQVAALRVTLSSDLAHVLLAASDTSARVAARGRERISGHDAEKVEVLARNAPWRMLYFDVASHRLIAFDQRERGPRGSYVERRVLSDYRPLSGTQWPYREERSIAGQRIMKLDMTDVQIDRELSEGNFQPPATVIPWR